MCASDKRRRPMAGCISQSLHASAVACAHWLGDICIDQRQAASADFYTHLTWPVRFGQATLANDKRRRPTAGVIGQVTLVVDCPHRRRLCKLLSQRRPWTACIDRGLCTSFSHRRAWPSYISLGPHTLVSRRRAWHAHIHLGLHTLVSRRQTSPASISFGLHTTVN